MLIDCPSCARSYHVTREDLGAHGRTVVCPRCDESWAVDSEGSPLRPAAANDFLTVAVSRRGDYAEAALPELATRKGLLRIVAPMLTCIVCLGAMMIMIGARGIIVRHAPPLAALYSALGMPMNMRGLGFADVTSARSSETSSVTVSGTIHNVSHGRIPVPRLKYFVRDSAGAEVASWTESASAKTLSAGRTLPFVSSPHLLPENSRSVLVRFETDDEAPQPILLARVKD